MATDKDTSRSMYDVVKENPIYDDPHVNEFYAKIFKDFTLQDMINIMSWAGNVCGNAYKAYADDKEYFDRHPNDFVNMVISEAHEFLPIIYEMAEEGLVEVEIIEVEEEA